MSKDSPREEIERMIGKRVENMKGLYIVGAILSWVATAFGVWVGFTYYPWAYAMASGIFALIVLTVIIVFAFIFIWKTAMEKPVNP
ncbi:MAG: hypothetical protein CMO16_04175 [Thaumarchaeota archaeon]|nr:hypothetical protein [Nitrososphaerota archaeon]|tara:strand:+ start:462 stop:719 length:258 start_codon:yes stop_codon:yes gene_type:complete